MQRQVDDQRALLEALGDQASREAVLRVFLPRWPSATAPRSEVRVS
jgi:hypothetical protein